MQPSPPAAPIPTSQRPINGALAGGGALLGSYLAKKYGLDAELAPVLGMAVSGAMATVASWAREVLETPTHPVAKLPLMLLARIG